MSTSFFAFFLTARGGAPGTAVLGGAGAERGAAREGGAAAAWTCLRPRASGRSLAASSCARGRREELGEGGGGGQVVRMQDQRMRVASIQLTIACRLKHPVGILGTPMELLHLCAEEELSDGFVDKKLLPGGAVGAQHAPWMLATDTFDGEPLNC